MDAQVLAVQQWLNRTYAGQLGIPPVAEDGITGGQTLRALTRALQRELGITALSDTFGPATTAAVTAHGQIGPGEANAHLVRIVQGALFCKGYSPTGFGDVYGPGTSAAVVRVRTDTGVGGPGTVGAKILQSLLTTDAYVLTPGGTAAVRAVQQWLNGRYTPRAAFTVLACDGHASRDLSKALVLGLQYELGLSDDVVNGTYGPTTQATLKARGLLATGATDGATQFVHLFRAALLLNGRPVAFTGTFDAALATTVSSFQAFVELPRTGRGDFATWSALLVSTGDPSRPATACDTVTPITAARASALKAAGYRTVARYLTNTPGSTLNKKIQPGELAAIFAKGLRVVPVFQTSAGSVAYFTDAQGRADARTAHTAAAAYGFAAGTTVYFAVDYDATDLDVDRAVLPYFRGVAAVLASLGGRYVLGVYGSRNVCARVSSGAGARWSFVSGMSTGFSGNLGVPLPPNWAFDQVATVPVGTGTGAVTIDKDVHKTGADNGVGSVTTAGSPGA